MRVRQLIAEPLLLNGHDKKAAEAAVAQALDDVGLEPAAADRFPHEFSGGQRQRIAIARAVAVRPKVIVLDEPVSALDVSVRAQVMNLLKDLKEDPGISMIFITHDIGLASDLCDSIAVAYAGQHVEFGPADRVLVEPRHPYSSLLLSSLPRLHDPVPPTLMPGEPPDLTNPPSGCRFHPRCWLYKMKGEPESCRTVVPLLRPAAGAVRVSDDRSAGAEVPTAALRPADERRVACHFAHEELPLVPRA